MEEEMEKEIGRLEKWGASPREAIRRMLDDQALYQKLLAGFYKDRDYDRLAELVQKQDYREAFCVAHKMKGSVLFLNLNPLGQDLSVLTKLLRPFYEEKAENYEEKKNEILHSLRQTGRRWREFCEIVL